MTEHYILFSIGPVQRAIAQARRTQDLWAGSQILSELARAGLQFATQNGAQVIYPIVDLNEPELSIPNRFLIRMKDEDIKDKADKIETAIRTRWDQMASIVRDGLSMPFNGDDLWEPQIKDYIEVYYVIAPVSGDYQEDNRRLNVMLTARKQLRDFEQTPAQGHKCTITGEQEALHDQAPGKISLRDLQKYWQTVRSKQPNKAMLAEGERLCAPSLVKRLVHDYDPQMQNVRFPSTSSIASAAFRSGLITHWTVTRPLIRRYMDTLEDVAQAAGTHLNEILFRAPERVPYIDRIIAEEGLVQDNLLTDFLKLDGDWLYPEALTIRQIETYTGVHVSDAQRSSVQTAFSNARVALKGLRDALKAQQDAEARLDVRLTSRSDYYVVLAMDGDNMGKTTANFREERQHQTFSTKLASFARDKVRPIIQEHVPGRVIYAGGDDILALLPLPYAFYVMQQIMEAFGLQDMETTISAGAAIVHRTHPLQDAIEAARQAEAQAKELPDKNAFAVQFLRRSGEGRTGRSSWYVEGYSVLAILMEASNAMRKKQLAYNLPIDLEQMTYAMVPQLESWQLDRWHVNIPSEARALEFQRIFKRRCADGYRGSKAADELRDHLILIADHMGTDGSGWQSLTDLMHIARFLAQEGGVYVATHTTP